MMNMEKNMSDEQKKIKELLLNQEFCNDKSEELIDTFSKFDLIQLLKKTQNHSTAVEKSNEKLHQSVEKLERALDEECGKCKTLEQDKTFLRTNIKKASANWFERKAKLSEGDSESLEDDISINLNENETKTKGDSIFQSFISEETVELFSELKFKDEQIDLSDRQLTEVNKRVKEFEKVIDDQEVVIHGLETQLDTYFHDNRIMSKQLAVLHKLFVDLEAINDKEVKIPLSQNEDESVLSDLPTSDEFKEMSGSVAKTYIKLKELIYEKKSLVTEIERLKTLNVELQDRVSHQETRLINVSDAIRTTWLLVSNLQDEHEKLHTAETILRYELKEKREILNRLKIELECSREQWHTIRQKNLETEQEWTTLREELNERRKLRKIAEMNGNQPLTMEEIEGAVCGKKASGDHFEPPVDLLVDMGIEYGVVNPDDDESIAVVTIMEGQDIHESRLQNLEDQCSFLYQKLMTSTSRALTLASHLTSLHEHYGSSDDEEEDDSDEEGDEDDEHYLNYDDDGQFYESEMASPDSASYDTAYVSEADGADSSGGGDNAVAVVDENLSEVTSESPELDDNGDVLSRRLITFLPRKMEIFRVANEKLEEKLNVLQEEKLKSEATLNGAIEFERRQRRQLEQQLSHLGKCVDELKLERNGKIVNVEEELRKKIAEIEKEEKDYEQLQEDFESLTNKYEERGTLLQLTTTQLDQTVKDSEEKLVSLQKEIKEIKTEICQSRKNDASTTLIQNEDKLSVGCIPKIIATPQNLSEIKFSNEMKKMMILTQSCLRISVHLDIDSVLCWKFCVTPQQIQFSIHLNNGCHSGVICQESKSKTQNSTRPFSTHPLKAKSAPIEFTKELLCPSLIRSSISPTTGRVIPKVAGTYSVVFYNSLSRIQELCLQIWSEKTPKSK